MEESVTDLVDNGESFEPPIRIDGAMPRGYCGNLTGPEIQQVSLTCGRCQRLVKDECPCDLSSINCFVSQNDVAALVVQDKRRVIRSFGYQCGETVPTTAADEHLRKLFNGGVPSSLSMLDFDYPPAPMKSKLLLLIVSRNSCHRDFHGVCIGVIAS